jgi:2-polyprenyl-6-methoxyphenol hydroxylase-like FAD-dependent oxidoreductase
VKIICVGGGPAGLYFAILMKLRDARHDVTVIERNPAGVTYGWGVVFWDDLLDDLYRCDPSSAREVHHRAMQWHDQEVHVGAGRAHIGGYGFSMSRKQLLDILAQRAASLGVDVQFERNVADLSEFASADLIVACDGARSQIRQRFASHFQTHADEGRNKYIWLGTTKAFDAFTFAFEETPFGCIWFHAYRFDRGASTCIVECASETWAGLGFGGLAPDQGTELLQDIFNRHLDRHPLICRAQASGKAPWLNFIRITNRTWFRDNVVLMGDAAHTTHFSIGSGTKLAIEDAIALAENLHGHNDLSADLRAYECQQKSTLRTLQKEARDSTEWFETVDSRVAEDPVQLAYSLWQRRNGQTPPKRWRYYVHLATQRPVLRRARRVVGSGRRWLRTRRRP